MSFQYAQNAKKDLRISAYGKGTIPGCIHVVLIQWKPPEKKKKTKTKWGFFQGKPPGKRKKQFPRARLARPLHPPNPNAAKLRARSPAGSSPKILKNRRAGSAEALCGAPSWDKSMRKGSAGTLRVYRMDLPERKRLLALFCSACGFNLSSV